jgi:hypothetical protein
MLGRMTDSNALARQDLGAGVIRSHESKLWKLRKMLIPILIDLAWTKDRKINVLKLLRKMR